MYCEQGELDANDMHQTTLFTTPSETSYMIHDQPTNSTSFSESTLEHTYRSLDSDQSFPQNHSSPPDHGATLVEESVVGPKDHSYNCTVYGDRFQDPFFLTTHARQRNHVMRRCGVQPCKYSFSSWNLQYQQHLREAHAECYTCSVCRESFSTHWELTRHASHTGHTSLICPSEDCGKAFSRLDTYSRHQRNHQKDAKRFPCKLCKKYRGSNGFKRKDHLAQHVRGYHHVEGGKENQGVGHFSRMHGCLYTDCPLYWQYSSKSYGDVPYRERKDAPFKKSSEYMEHMRKVHDESDFPCPRSGCERIGAKGYFRKADLRTHLKKVHGTDGYLEGDRE